MLLICVAHKGEAQSFIHGLSMKLVENNFYQVDDLCLLITGEGPFQVMARLPYFLGKYNIQKIYNFGIGGALSKELTLNSIYSIRTFYAYGETTPRFHSYSTTDSEIKIDAITTEYRVLSDEQSAELFNYATIVDREGWAIGKVSHEFNLPFYSYKLISDYAGTATNCFDIKSMAKTYSDQMFEYFLELDHLLDATGAPQITLPFHASFTQRKRIEALLNLLDDPILDELITGAQLNAQTLSGKEQANQFISFLENKINPISTKAMNQLDHILRPLTICGAKVNYDKKLEKKSFSLRMDINSQTNIDKLIKALAEINFNNIEDVWEGKLDV